MSVLMMAWLGAGAAQRTPQTKTAAADNAPPPTEGSSPDCPLPLSGK